MKSKRFVYCKVYAIEYDGKPLFSMMEDTGFTAEGCKLYVESEGGFIDEKSIIRRGDAVDKELEKFRNFTPVQSEWDSMVEHDRLIIQGLAKDDFVLTKEEQIKAGLRKGKLYEPPQHKVRDIYIDHRYICRQCSSIMELMFKYFEQGLTMTAAACEKMVTHYGGVVTNGRISW